MKMRTSIKVLEIVDLFHIPNITQDHVMLRAFLMSLTGAAGRWLRNEPSDMQEVILFYKGLEVPTRQILDSKGAIPTMTAVDAKRTIEEGEVVNEPMIDVVKTRNDNNMVNRINGYPSYRNFDRKIHINCAYNLQFSCMIGFEHVNTNFSPILSISVMSKKFYNSIMKEKVEYNGRNVLGTFMNAPIFVGNFSIVTDFTVVENMDAYREEGMREVIVGEPFCKASYVEARRFDGMITIFNGNDW
ncbi:hypothetical protein Tco_1304349 [Tanacetum coccineum]